MHTFTFVLGKTGEHAFLVVGWEPPKLALLRPLLTSFLTLDDKNISFIKHEW